MTTEADFVECTTQSRKLRHWSQVPTAQWRDLYPLCGSSPWAVSTVAALDPPTGRKRVIVADLPECKQCAKSKARRIAGRPS